MIISFSKTLMISLPGGVTHALDGFCIALIIVPVTPITPLNVKNPPLIDLFMLILPPYKIASPFPGEIALSHSRFERTKGLHQAVCLPPAFDHADAGTQCTTILRWTCILPVFDQGG